MKIICKTSDLLNSINIALRAVPMKTTMPILECILITVTENFIKLTSNDMEFGIETLVKGEIIEPGEAAINADFISKLVRKYEGEEVSIETDKEHNVSISCDESNVEIPTLAGDEFPSLPSVEKKEALEISQFTLKELVRQTVFSISDSENSKIMTGELFEVKDNMLRVVALDGHRISVRKTELKNPFQDTKVIIPGKTLNEISKILSSETEDEMRIYFTGKHVIFEFGDTVILSRLIEGEYYKIDQMLTNDYDTKITVNKKKFMNSIDRASLLVKESEKKPIIIDVKEEKMQLEMTSSIGRKINESVDISKEGADILIGFNPKFLIDALKVIDEEEVTLYMTNPKAPCFIKNEEEGYIYLILPVNFNAAARH